MQLPLEPCNLSRSASHSMSAFSLNVLTLILALSIMLSSNTVNFLLTSLVSVYFRVLTIFAVCYQRIFPVYIEGRWCLSFKPGERWYSVVASTDVGYGFDSLRPDFWADVEDVVRFDRVYSITVVELAGTLTRQTC